MNTHRSLVWELSSPLEPETKGLFKSPVVDLDEDSGLGMEENKQPFDSPLLCSFGGLLSAADGELHNTSLAELQGNLPKLKNKTEGSATTKRALFNQKRQLEIDTPKIPSKRRCRKKSVSILKKSLSFGDKPAQIQEKSEISTEVVNKLLEDECDLIADGSRPYCLPTVQGKHRDLKSITAETVVDLISGKYDDVVDNYRIIDCRYPFEYEGGHIKGAENLYTQDNIRSLVTEISNKENTDSKQEILIFHCEFSSERGPKMSRLLRNKDREVNAANYPQLKYPEIYLLDGGYKVFYHNDKTFCEPMEYKPMLHKDHAADVRHFRSKSKSWTAGEKKKNLTRILF